MSSVNMKKELRLRGLGLSKGCAVGRVCMFDDYRHNEIPMYRIETGEIAAELKRFERACEVTAKRLDDLREVVAQDIGRSESEIFVAQEMILRDDAILAQIRRQIEDRQVNVESAVQNVFNEHERRIALIENEYISSRATDIGELKRRLLDVLANMRPALKCAPEVCRHGRNRIIVAEELTPSLTVDLDHEHTIGFVTERGGRNSHAAILARAIGVPAVGNLPGIREKVGCGAELFINGDTGEVVLWPSEKTVSESLSRCVIDHGMPEPVAPVPGVKVLANLGLPSDVEYCLEMQAEGVGLYRSEFELLAAGRFLSEDELYDSYLKLRQGIPAGQRVVLRMFDIGSDKQLAFMGLPREENPALGWRGSRLLLDSDDLFICQARAIARASLAAPIDVLYPMIVDLRQFLQIRRKFMDVCATVEHGELRHGAMFEVPSACLRAEEILAEADFGSIGTNDLAQYLFAVDRENEKVSDAYDLDHPVFWDMIARMAAAARSCGKSLSVCGELGGDPEYTGRFLELGVREVSVSPRRIPEVRRAAARI
jgi:phosphoenolpyruvate-protein phosphotransferase (PTS system enzyme I)